MRAAEGARAQVGSVEDERRQLETSDQKPQEHAGEAFAVELLDHPDFALESAAEHFHVGPQADGRFRALADRAAGP